VKPAATSSGGREPAYVCDGDAGQSRPTAEGVRNKSELILITRARTLGLRLSIDRLLEQLVIDHVFAPLRQSGIDRGA
jgi:hypothetical protein